MTFSNSKMFCCLLFLFAYDKVGRINMKNIILGVLFLALRMCRLMFGLGVVFFFFFQTYDLISFNTLFKQF